MNEVKTAVELAPTILALIDFSEASKDVLKWAAHLTMQHHANLKIVYPYRLTQLKGRDDLPQLKRNIESEAQGHFTKLAENIFKDSPACYDFKAEVGFMNDRVHSYTRRSEVLLVVISKRMANANKEALDELLIQLRAPLLIVPQADEKTRYN